jgi:hypothetical protein
MTMLEERPVLTEPTTFRDPVETDGAMQSGAWFGRSLKRLALDVNHDVMARSERGNPTMCMLAVALSDAGFKNPHIQNGMCTVDGYGDLVTENTPIALDPAILEAARAFDRGETIAPFTLYIQIEGF